jgi:hypothetical protein
MEADGQRRRGIAALRLPRALAPLHHDKRFALGDGMDALPQADGRAGLAALEAQVARDLALIAYPEPEWVPPRRSASGERVLDVLVVGAGQGGLVTLFALRRDRITKILAIDRKPEGMEGPWRDFARMRTLRSWKTVTGPDLDIPSLTFQSWFEAQWGARAFAALDKIAKDTWADYLAWYRRVLDLPVRNGVELVALAPQPEGLAATVLEAGRERKLLARKLVLATGIETPGRWWMPDFVAALPRHLRAHTRSRSTSQPLRAGMSRCSAQAPPPSTMRLQRSSTARVSRSAVGGRRCSVCSPTSRSPSRGSSAASRTCRTRSAGVG